MGNNNSRQYVPTGISDITSSIMTGADVERFAEPGARPLAVKISAGFTLFGSLMLTIAIASSASTWTCVEECVRSAEIEEDRLLTCIDSCEAHEENQATCRQKCQLNIGFSRRQVQRQEAQCEEGCSSPFPGVITFTGIVGSLALLPVAPLMGAYKNACHCECCAGQGCSGRLAFFVVSWVCFAMSMLMVLPTIVEDPEEVGAKAHFGFLQAIAVSAMAASRYKAGAWTTGQPNATNGHVRELDSLVGRAVGGPSVGELHTQISNLENQVSRLTRVLEERCPDAITWTPSTASNIASTAASN